MLRSHLQKIGELWRFSEKSHDSRCTVFWQLKNFGVVEDIHLCISQLCSGHFVIYQQMLGKSYLDSGLRRLWETFEYNHRVFSRCIEEVIYNRQCCLVEIPRETSHSPHQGHELLRVAVDLQHIVWTPFKVCPLHFPSFRCSLVSVIIAIVTEFIVCCTSNSLWVCHHVLARKLELLVSFSWNLLCLLLFSGEYILAYFLEDKVPDVYIEGWLRLGYYLRHFGKSNWSLIKIWYVRANVSLPL